MSGWFAIQQQVQVSPTHRLFNTSFYFELTFNQCTDWLEGPQSSMLWYHQALVIAMNNPPKSYQVPCQSVSPERVIKQRLWVVYGWEACLLAASVWTLQKGALVSLISFWK